MHDHNLHDSGLEMGWALYCLSLAGQWLASHALPLLNGVALLVGIACQVYTMFLRHREAKAKAKSGGAQ